MPYRVNLVIRQSKRTGEHFFGAASKLPLSHYDHVTDVAQYYGIQMRHRPAQAAALAGERMAAYINRGQPFSHAVLHEYYRAACNELGVHPRYRIF